MIPNCEGCEYEFWEAYDWQSKGYGVVLDGMGERKHVLITVFDKDGKIVLE